MQYSRDVHGIGPSTSSATPKRLSKSKVKFITNLQDATDIGFDSLRHLDRANFMSGVHFCPPHFVDHRFFTEEMAEEFRRDNLMNGPLRDYEGKIWEELIYHGLMDNLPHLVENTTIRCMWIFYGLMFVPNCRLLSLLPLAPCKEMEIDFLIVGLTKRNQIFMVPIEVKTISDSGRCDKKVKTKAVKQCEEYRECLEKLVQLVSQHSFTPCQISVHPAILLCCNKESVMGSFFRQNCTEADVEIFNVYFDKYKKFRYDPATESSGNFFGWIASLVSDDNKLSFSKFQNLICLLTTILSCKVIGNNTKHDKTTCFQHYRLEAGKELVCMKGTPLCPKFIHEFVVRNVNMLNYLKTFCVKTTGEPEQAAVKRASVKRNRNDSKNNKSIGSSVSPLTACSFKAHAVGSLPRDIAMFAKQFLSHITSEQKALLESDEKYVVIVGDYGAGKTLALLIKALYIVYQLKIGAESGRLRFVTTKNSLDLDIVPKFKSLFSDSTLEKYALFQSWPEFYKSEPVCLDDFCFLDEYSEITDSYYDREVIDGTKKNSEVMENIDISKLFWSNDFKHLRPNTTFLTNPINKMNWIVIAHNNNRGRSLMSTVETVAYGFHSLSWQLRNSHSTSYFYTISTRFDDLMCFNYPVYGARSRILHIPTGGVVGCILQVSPVGILGSVVHEVRYWRNQMKSGSILILYSTKSFSDVDLRHTFLPELEAEFNIQFRDLDSDAQQTQVTKSKSSNNRLYGYIYNIEGSQDIDFAIDGNLSSLEFDVVILTDPDRPLDDPTLWKFFSRAKYGISRLVLQGKDISNLKSAANKWGRCSVIEK